MGSCNANQVKSDNLEEINMNKDYQLADFHSVEGFFKGIDAEDIKNFYYADITNYNASWVPGPTVYIIEGYFEFDNEKWDSYISDYKWFEVSASDTPNIFENDIPSRWLQSYAWNDEHRPKGINGKYYINTENRVVFFSLFKG
jgi:hypothetical protein